MDARHASPATILALQRTAGNAAVTRLMENATGMPDHLKAGIEHLSGVPMDDVRVHYNSSKPDELQALSYTQGTEIHVGPGQERHLPHEAWHVVQQKQNRVERTTSAGGVAINDASRLEREADVMGALASGSNRTGDRSHRFGPGPMAVAVPSSSPSVVQRKPKAPTITHETTFDAPDGSAKTRTKVGVGEEVVFTGSAAGAWTAKGGGTPAKLDAGDKFTWTAPNRARSVTITLKVGKKRSSVTMKVVEPKRITGTKNSETAIAAGTAGAGMKLTFHYHPKSVSFGNVQAGEVSGPATNITGYYKKHYTKADLRHDSGDHFTAIGEDNRDTAEDTAETTDTFTPYERGGFDWVIPNRFRVSGEGGDGKRFTKVTQAFRMLNKAGKVRVTKAGAQVERSP